MDYQTLDKNIKIFGWLVGLLIISIALFFKQFGADFKAITKDNPGYGLLAICLPIVIAQVANYFLIGRYRSDLGVSNSYFKQKLLTSPGILAGIIIATWTFVIM